MSPQVQAVPPMPCAGESSSRSTLINYSPASGYTLNRPANENARLGQCPKDAVFSAVALGDRRRADWRGWIREGEESSAVIQVGVELVG